MRFNMGMNAVQVVRRMGGHAGLARKYKNMKQVTFLNPKRPRRSFCYGIQLDEKRIKNGVPQTRVLVPLPTPTNLDGYKVWVNDSDIFNPC